MIHRFTHFVLLFMLCLCAAGGARAQEAVLSWQSDITVRSDAALDIVERIRVRAEGDQLRIGLIRPFGATGGPDFSVELVEVRRDGAIERASLEKDGAIRRLELGDPAAPLATGEHLYVVHYVVRGAIAFEQETDRLRWDATPRDWDLPVSDASARVFLPNGMDAVRHKPKILTSGVRANDYITQQRSGTLMVDVMRPLKAGESLFLDVEWPKGVVTRPTQMEIAQRNVRGQLHVVAGIAGLCLLFLLSLLLRGLARKLSASSSGDSLGPAMSRLVRLGVVDDTSVVATAIGMATKGYLTIEHTETGAYLLQRTWKEGDLGLIPTDRAIATAFYKDKPSRFFIARENMESLREAQQLLREALQREIESVLLRVARPWLLVMAAAVLLVVGVVISFAPVTAMAWLPALLLLTGEVLCYRALCLRPSALRWQIGREHRGILSTLGDALTTRRCLPALVMILGGFVWLGVQFHYPAAIIVALAGCIGILTVHRLRAASRLGGRLIAAVDVSDEQLFDSSATLEPQSFERDMALAIALGEEAAWSRQYGAALADTSHHATYKPRWYSGFHEPFVPDNFAPRLAHGLMEGIGRAIG